ncbi:hypothetical protein [Pedobacter puniceum]|uniref:T9SS type A sorting domain-containing protein n=1 Tax=Pedobacter puniceum TaxID=2666136 RepID=A0A7K0FT59_9SPHI|nr:hypothetical protein [Pedobacter puniceum]MRX48490.1 hypothetical protein [Pedobacter puniceum]
MKKLIFSFLGLICALETLGQCSSWSASVNCVEQPQYTSFANGSPLVAYTAEVSPYAGAYNYLWSISPYPNTQYYIDNNLPIPSGNISGSGTTAIFYSENEGDFLIEVTAQSECGNIGASSPMLFVSYNSYSMYDTKLNYLNQSLEVYTNNKSLDFKGYKASLFDQSGKEISSVISQVNKKSTMKIGNLSKGEYALFIIEGKKLYRYKVII